MTDAVKMAIERVKARFHPHYGIDGASDSKQLASDCQTLIAALEQAGEPVADDAREKLAGEQGEQCERCQGNGEIVTDWDRYMHAHDGDVGDEAVADCPDCSGTGRIEGEAPLSPLQRLGQEFDAGEAEPIAWMWDYRVRYRDDGNDWSIGTVGRNKPPADNSDYRNVVPLYAHPPQSRVAAEPVGLRAVEGANSHVFDLRILIGDSDDEKAECIAFANEPWAGRIIAALATPSQPDPQSRGQAFDGEGEAVDAIMAALSEYDPTLYEQESWEITLMNVKPIIAAALSSAKRGEEG